MAFYYIQLYRANYLPKRQSSVLTGKQVPAACATKSSHLGKPKILQHDK